MPLREPGFPTFAFPFRPIQVSPLGASNFFSEWGLAVLVSEAIWIGVPALILIWGAKAFRNLFKLK